VDWFIALASCCVLQEYEVFFAGAMWCIFGKLTFPFFPALIASAQPSVLLTQ